MCKSVLIAKEKNYRVIYYNKTSLFFLYNISFFFIKNNFIKRIFLLFIRNFFYFLLLLTHFFI